MSERPDARPSAALRAAERAAAAAGVVVVEVEGVGPDRGTAAVERIFDEIWSTDGASVMPDEVLRMYALTGQYLSLAVEAVEAVDRAARPGPSAGPPPAIAASLGILAAPAGMALHSHVTGVLPAGLGRGVGRAIKLHQRAWALQRGLGVVSWTFDPLIRRNAWFNLAKLGARPVRYLVDFYGAMPDAINAGDASDRLYVHWHLASPEVAEAAESAESAEGGGTPPLQDADSLRANGFLDLIEILPDGGARPVASDQVTGSRVRGGVPGALVATPADVEDLRRRDLPAALTWRRAVREALGGALDAGWQIIGITRDGHYILVPQGSDRPQEDR